MKNLIWILIAAFVLPINAQNRKKSQAIADQNVANWRYDVICNGSGGTDTSYLLDVSVYVPNANLGLETAKKSAIHAVLFNRFAGDKETWGIDRQFLWGPSLLISPVLDEVRAWM